MVKRLGQLISLVLLLSAQAIAGGGRRDGIALSQIGTYLRTTPGGSVRVCSMPATGSPCTNLAHIYSNVALTSEILPQGIVKVSSDAKYTYYAETTVLYHEEISGIGVTTKVYDNVGMTGAGSGGGGASTSGTFVTSGTEVSLPNARKLVSGDNISIDITIPGQIKISGISSFAGGTVTGDTYFTSGRPSFDVNCTNSLVSDTALLQTAVNSARAIVGSAPLTPATGVVNIYGPCSFDGTTLDLTGGNPASNDFLIIKQYGNVFRYNGAIRLPLSTVWSGVHGGGAFTSFGPDYSANIINGDTVDVPIFETGTLAGVSQQQSVIIEHMTVRKNIAAGTAPTVHFFAPIQDLIRYSAVDNRQATAFVADQPGFLSGAGFSLTLLDNTFSTGNTTLSAKTVSITDVGNVFIGGDNPSWFLGGGILFTDDTHTSNGGSIIITNVDGEELPDGASFVETNSSTGPGFDDIQITDAAMSDPVGSQYVFKKTGAGGGVRDLIIKRALYFTDLIDPSSDNGIQLGAGSDVAIGSHATALLTIPSVISALPATVYANRSIGFQDDIRRTFAPVTTHYLNIIDRYTPASWVSGCTAGVVTAVSGQPDPAGGTQGVLVTSSSGIAGCDIYRHTESPPPVGTIYMGGIWARATTTNGYAFTSATYNIGLSGDGTINGWIGQEASGTDEAWHWIPFIKTVTTAGTASEVIFTVLVQPTTPTVYAFPLFIRIPAGTITGPEAVQQYQALTPYAPSCTIGELCSVNGPIQNVAGALEAFVGGFRGVLTHANSADHTYNFPNISGNVLVSVGTITATHCLAAGSTAGTVVDAGVGTCGTGGGGGSGTVTSVAISDIAPLLTFSVANPTTAAAITPTLTSAAANTVFGNCTIASATPAYCGLTLLMLPSGTGLATNRLDQNNASNSTTSAQFFGLISDEVGTGKLIGSQNPLFTGTLTVAERLDLTGGIAPPQITTDQNDYNPTGLSAATSISFTTDASHNMTGLQGGSSGRIMLLLNTGSNNLQLISESASSSAANRFALTSNTVVPPNQVLFLVYASSRWRTSFASFTGIVACSQLPALTGDVTSVAGNCATTVAKVNGVSYPSGPSTSQVPIVTGVNAVTYKTIPNCGDTAGQHINWNNSTFVFSCGTSSSGGGVAAAGTPTAGQAAEWTNATTIDGVSTAGGGATYTKSTLTSPSQGDYLCENGSTILVNCTPGVAIDARTTTTEAISCTVGAGNDRGKQVTFANAANIAVSIPSAASCGNNFFFSYKVLGAGKVTFTPTTSTVQVNDTSAGATFVALSGQSGSVTSDNTNYQATRLGYASATSSSISGAIVGLGCDSSTVTILGAASGMQASVTPSTYPGDGLFWNAYISGADTITIKVCSDVTVTPTASVYNVRLVN